MMDRRLPIVQDEERYQKVAREAGRRGTSIAAVIRKTIDNLPADPDVRRAAVLAILAAQSAPVPADPQTIRDELDSAHDRADA